MSFVSLSEQLIALQRWYELGIDPPEVIADTFGLGALLQKSPMEVISKLPSVIKEARIEMNRVLSISPEENEMKTLEIKRSLIPGAGDGLFVKPDATIRKGTTICNYWGDLHDWESQQKLADRSYLLFLGHNSTVFKKDIFVDPRARMIVNARYINDPINVECLNCEFCRDPESLRARVVATREIEGGEELFVDYGDVYWASSPFTPTIYNGSNVKALS